MGMIKMYMKKYIKKFPIFFALLAFCPQSNPHYISPTSLFGGGGGGVTIYQVRMKDLLTIY